MRDNEFLNEIKAVENSIKAMKSTQKMTGDSWILYKYAGTFNTDDNIRRYIVFTANDPNILATVRMNQEGSAFEIFPTGIRNQNGKYFWVLPDGYSDTTFVVHSTQPGSVSITTVPPF